MNLGATLERGARLFGNNEAVVDGDRRWTYAELRARTAGFDASLGELGLAPGDVVAVLMLNSAPHLVAWLGIPRGGRVLNDLNVRLAPAELEFILNDSGARALMVDDAFAEMGADLAARCESIDHVIYAGGGETPDGWLAFDDLCAADGGPPATVDPDATAGIFYTGGTTGLPKGVMLSHRNLVENAKHTLIILGYTSEHSYLHAAPMFHAADGTSNFALTWVGGRHVFIPSFDPQLWPATVASEGVTHAVLVPTMINMVVNDPGIGEHDLSSFRLLAYGGSPMPIGVIKRAQEVLPGELIQLYGMTEASPIVTTLSAEDHRRGGAGEEPFATRLRSAGTPIVGVEAEVRRDDGTPADVGEPGEICVRGGNIMKGYLSRPDETAAVLDEDGWYHSGDAAYQDADGYLYIVDRIRDMIVSGGENVYCSEVENAIYQHPAVLEAAVFGVPDDKWGESVHAAVVLRPGQEADEGAIIAHCRELIGGYKVPRSIEFHDQPLPKSGAGKLLKRELRKPHWAGRERQVG